MNVEVELDDVIDFIDNATPLELEKIKNELTMKVDVELYDIINFIDNATPLELEKIKKELLVYVDDFVVAENLYEREKVLILKEAMMKYTIEELVERMS